MSLHSKFRHAFTVALSVSFLGLLAQAFAQPPSSRIRPVSTKFAFVVEENGTESVALFDAKGNVIDTISLREDVAVFGSSDFFALLSRDLSRPQRGVQILDARGTVVSAFRIPRDMDIAVGRQTIVLYPRAEHSVGTAYDLEFRSFHGKPFAAYQREDLMLRTVESASNDNWVAISLNRARGRYIVDHFGVNGKHLWKFEVEGLAVPTVGISASGDRAAVGVLLDDLRTSRFYLLDGSGVPSGTRDVPEFRSAIFSHDEGYLLLVGQGAVQLLSAQDASTLWSSSEDVFLAPGKSVAFSSDDTRFYLVSQERRPSGGPERVSLKT